MKKIAALLAFGVALGIVAPVFAEDVARQEAPVGTVAVVQDGDGVTVILNGAESNQHPANGYVAVKVNATDPTLSNVYCDKGPAAYDETNSANNTNCQDRLPYHLP